MRVLVFPSWYPTPGNPLNGTFFREQALALKKAGMDVCVLAMTFYRLREIGCFLKIKNKLAFENDNGVATYHLRYLKFFPRMETVFFYYFASIFRKIYHYIEKQRGAPFDIVHIHSALDAGIIYWLSKIQTKYVLTEHSTVFQRNILTNIQKKYVPLCFDRAAQIIAVGNGLRDALRTYTSREISVVYNLVRLDLFFLPAKKKEAGNKFRFFSLGMSLYKKGFDILIAAYRGIPALESTELCIAGLEEHEVTALQEMAVQYRLEKRVIVQGKLSREETARQMRRADCFVLTSRFETFGIVFVEAMACGKPVIASKTGGPDSFITPETGILVQVENIAETAAAMETMFFKASSFDPDYIRNYAVKNFSEDVITKKIIGIYDAVANLQCPG
jgi:glycosyltransferase involved in cell wall biosynthesis